MNNDSGALVKILIRYEPGTVLSHQSISLCNVAGVNMTPFFGSVNA